MIHPDLDRALTAVRDLGRALRETVEDGRLDAASQLLDERAEALATLATLVDVRSETLDAETRARLDALRTEEARLLEWMQDEKRRVGRALSSLREGGRDPWREELSGHAVLDQRR